MEAARTKEVRGTIPTAVLLQKIDMPVTIDCVTTISSTF